jgi:hypothetical protein
MTAKIIYRTDHQSHCYPSDPEQFDDLTIQLWDDGDVTIENEEADIIININDLADITKELIDRLMVHNHEAIATIRKQLELHNGE